MKEKEILKGERVVYPPFRMDGELIKKEVTHDYTVLTIQEADGDEEATVLIPHDLDDFIKVGAFIKIEIQQLL